MTDTKTCAFDECGREFTPKRHDQEYCSVPCRRKASRVRCGWEEKPAIMVRCHNILCGKWFVGRSSRAAFCSTHCAQATHRRKKDGNPTASNQNDTFICPECKRLTKKKTVNSKTCGSKKCLGSYARKWRANPKYTRKAPPEEQRPDRSGWRECLGWCGKKFFSDDKPTITYCPKCRHKKYSMEHEYRFAPAGW